MRPWHDATLPVWALVVLVAASGCLTSCPMEKTMSYEDLVPVEELPEATGADVIRLSRNGRWLAFRLNLASELPLVVVLDRTGQVAPRATRGLLSLPPRDDGTLYYLEQEGPDMQRLFSSNEGRTTHLRRLGDARRLATFEGAHGSRLIDERRIAIMGGPDDRPMIRVFDTDTEQIIAERELPAELGIWQGWAASSRYIHLYFSPQRTAETRDTPDALLTLATEDLRELWRRRGVAPSIIFSSPRLGLAASGRRLLLTSQTSRTIATFDASTGEPGPVLESPTGSMKGGFLPTAQPDEDAYFLWYSSSRGPLAPRHWSFLRVRGDTIEILAQRSRYNADRSEREVPPAGALWDGSRFLVAQRRKSFAEEPGDWQEHVLRYLRLVEQPNAP